MAGEANGKKHSRIFLMADQPILNLLSFLITEAMWPLKQKLMLSVEKLCFQKTHRIP